MATFAPRKSGFGPKYRAKKVKLDGYTFDSKAEAAHYQTLKFLLAVGKIRDLSVHYRYPLVVDDVLITTYVADFRFWDGSGLRVQDVKGYVAKNSVPYRLFLMKKALMLAIYGIEVEEIRNVRVRVKR